MNIEVLLPGILGNAVSIGLAVWLAKRGDKQKLIDAISSAIADRLAKVERRQDTTAGQLQQTREVVADVVGQLAAKRLIDSGPIAILRTSEPVG